ncbi:MAG: urease accessory protein UreD [Selenomonas sp.]|nr:urease accessory protein UreD [Selenomonas sp.]
MTQSNPFGRTSELSLVLAPGKIRHLAFTAPFKVLHPFHQGDFLQIMVVKVSAGLMAGDRQSINIVLEPGTKAEFLSQSYEKIHQMEEGEASREGEVTVGSDATLLYTPLPVLPFADSAFRSTFCINLADGTSRLFYSDILACGRAARGERFAYRLYRSRVRITSGGTLLYADNFRFSPREEGMDYESFTQYEGYTHLGNYVLCHFAVTEDELRTCLKPVFDGYDGQAGLTRFGDNNLCLKILANGSELLVAVQDAIKSLLKRHGAERRSEVK